MEVTWNRVADSLPSTGDCVLIRCGHSTAAAVFDGCDDDGPRWNVSGWRWFGVTHWAKTKP